MRRVIHAAIILSVVAVLLAILGVASADSAIDRMYDGVNEDDPFWPLAGIAALVAAVALAFIWLGVFVAYVVLRGVRALR
jgi:hypothetical protein